MSEKIFTLLLRLYPSRFRQQYAEEAIALLRDRLRDERGVARRLRLYFDLLADIATGLPLAYRNSYAAPAPEPASGLPGFHVLDEEPLQPGSVMLGSVFAVAALAAFVFVMNHASAYHPFARLHGMANHSTGQATSNVEEVAEELDEQVRAASAAQSCGFEKMELHPGNIGYVKLTWFGEAARCGDFADAVMEKLNATDAVIFDLRDCRGGFPETVRQIAGWLFDRPAPWYNPRDESSAPSFTRPVPGSRLANKPIFILTSSRTFSGGEHFAYDLKTLKRATLVGETTSGAAHGNGPPPDGSTKPAWEGTGVEPDVKVKPEDALRTAENLAKRQLTNK